MKKTLNILIILLLIWSCKNKNPKIASLSESNQNYSDFFLEQDTINSFFRTNPETEKIAQEVNLFYKKRNFQLAWFNKNGMTQAVPNFQNQLLNYSYDFDDKSLKSKQLDSLVAVVKTNKKDEINQQQRENLDLVLTTTFFKYSEKAYSGINKNTNKLDWYIPRSKKNFQVLLDSLVLKDKNEKTNEPVNRYYSKLKEKLKLYRTIQKNGGFPLIKTNKKNLVVIQTDSCLLAVKQRLFLSGDLKKNDHNIVFTDSLSEAVLRFQQRLGLPVNGVLDSKTVEELNKTVDFRIKQMLVNLERLRWIPVELESNYTI